MKATYNGKESRININDRKESRFAKQFSGIVYDNGKFREVVTLRLYRTDARVYACVWTWHTAGSGHAGGYGYHKDSAAAQTALHRAGYSFDRDIVGDSLIREAVEAVCKVHFPECPCTVVEAYA